MDTSNASAKSKTSASGSSSINGIGSQIKHISSSQDIGSSVPAVTVQDEKSESHSHSHSHSSASSQSSQSQSQSQPQSTVLTVVGQSISKSSTGALAVLHLPPPTATALVQASANIADLGSMPRARPSFVSNTSSTAATTATSASDGGKPMAVAAIPPASPVSISEPTCPPVSAVSMAPSACDFDSDTELSIVAAAAAVSASAGIDSRSPTSPPTAAASTIMPQLNSSAGGGGVGGGGGTASIAGSQSGFGAGSGAMAAGNTNGHSTTSSSSTHLSLNAKQQRQQKRRRERAQRLQAERDSRCNASSLSGTFIAGSSVGVGSAMSAANGGQGGGVGLVTPNSGVGGGSSAVAMGNGSAAGPGNNGMIYHINSAGSMGEDSNNSNGNFTSSSNGSNNLLPPTDSIASLLLNPPHSPECNSGLMATPSDSEGESLDEDLLSTSSSSTLLLPRDKPPPRPPPPVRRKLPRSPVLEEEIIDGFAILEFKTYEDLEFAIKLGQKRKEKRLSALDELTCTYSIEEMKIPKVIDTGQSQPLRVTSLSTLTVNNNNLKENPQPSLHRDRGGNVISNNNNNNSSNNNNSMINSNGPNANSNSSSLSNVVYLLPSVNMVGNVLETEAEPRDHWRSEYGQQQDQLQSDNSANSKSNNNISDDNQINNSSHQINHTTNNQSSKQQQQAADGGCNASKMQVNNSATVSTRFLENDNDSLMLDISLPSLGVGGAVSHSHDHIDVGVIHASCTGSSSSDTKKSHNSPATSNNTIDQLHVTKPLPTHQLNNLISSDLNAAANANANSNHLGVCKLGSQSAQVAKKSMGLENIETVTTSAACCSLDIQELANVSAQSFGASSSSSSSSSIKKENEQSDLLNDASTNCSSNSKGNNICDNVSNDKKNSEQIFDIDNPPTPMNISNTSSCSDRSSSRKLSDLPHLKKKSAACGDRDNGPYAGVPFAPAMGTVSPDSDPSKALNIKNASESAPGKAVHGHAGAPIPPPAASMGDPGNRELGGVLQKSSPDKPLYPSLCAPPSVSSVQFPNVGISAGNEKIASTVASDIDQKIIFNSKATASVSNGLSSGVQRSIVPLLSAAPSPAAVTLSSPFSAHIAAAPNAAGLSILTSASSVILANSSIKSNDSFTRGNTNNGSNNGSSNGQGQLSSVGLSSTSEIAKSNSVPTTSSPPNPIVNGFLSVYPPPATIATSSVTTSALPRVSPNAANKLVPPVSATSSISINPNYVGISGGTTTTSGMGKVVFGAGGNAIVGTGSPLLFPGAPPAPISHVATGVPMIIQAPPYRAPYTNYPLYTPYSGLTHGSYLPPVLPVATPNLSNLPPTQHRSSDSRNSRESPASLKSTPSNIGLSVSMAPTLRSITPLNNSSAISSGASQPVVSVVPSANSAALSMSNPHISHSHHVPVYASGAFSSAAAGTSTPNSGLSTLAVTSLSTSAAPQPHSHFPQSTQMLPQSGNFSSVSHLLTTHPMSSQNQPMVRCGSTLYSSASAAATAPPSAAAAAAVSNFTPSVLAVQSLTTAVTSSSSSPSTLSSSVIQKVISPKGESPCNKDRDSSYSTNIRSHGASTMLPGASQGIGLGSSFCGIAPSQYGGTGTPVLSSSSSMPPGLGNLSSYSSKAALWLNSPANAVVTTCAPTTPIVSSGSARPTPPLSNCTSMGIGMLNAASTARSSCNAISPLSIPATAGIHVSAANPSFQSSSYFPAPLAPPPSSPSPATSSAAIISSSASQFNPAVSHSMSSIVTTAGATTTTASSVTQPTAAAISNPVTNTPHPFSAESLFQPSKNDQADLLRRELDSRFLDRSGLAVTPTPPSSTYLRTDLQHQQHAHLHQHPQLLPPVSASSTPLTAVQPSSGQIFPPPLFKDISKISSVDPQFYRTGMGLPPGGYTGYTSAGLLHSGLGGPTPFMPPNHLTSFAPKKTGRWNAMHVRIAWEIYYHQNKQSPEKQPGFPTASSNAGSINAPIPPGNMISGGGGGMASGASTPVNNVAAIPAVGGGVLVSNGPPSVLGMKTTPNLGMSSAPQHILHRASEMPPSAAFPGGLPGRLAFETSPLAASFIGAPPSHIGTAVSPFGRYVTPFGFTGLTHFGGHLDSWRTNAMQRSVAYHPSSAAASPNWPVKSDPGLDNARREAEERERELRDREQRERDRQRREREERERKEKEEKLKREQQERERERERDRKERERERREIERREMERERMLQQQRINESNKQAAVQAAAAATAPVRDRSPHRNVGELNTEIRIKEEHPRTKEEQDVMLLRASAAAVGVGDPRYHSSSLAAAQASAAAAAAHHHHANFMAASRHGLPPPPSHLTRTMMPPTLSVGGPITHFGAPAPPGWGIDPYRDPYPILRYNPIMEAALRHEAEERQKAINIYAAQSAAHLRSKEPSPIPPSVGSLGPPPPHHRLQIVSSVAQSGVQQPGPPSQQQQQQMSSGGGMVKNSGGPPAPGSIPVQHMISVDSMGQQSVSAKKESDHTMGIVSNAGVGLSSVPGGVIGISPVSSVAPSR
ncbi:serine-rich adhesin for platelets [Drosophila simulans]|uniref:serine-rich adhesin for platelets n=1 Tax=Drosophila simulans TaxID=7240 RepID=UPI00192CEEAC|nr:serine-rich adhesin for platelets [Drosophila simulans]XP_039153264.1 serine-rich adhesin for platelets [Drosophila simulans]XP_039153265.1 serine-rich adhesin for platelets [Drosophila simulans]XP_039153266.1 serine-rich adhesin for platelets [Drosophila simulans]XP_039153267.1 serine-rich adhesin for platelets [Drosophila simulans]